MKNETIFRPAECKLVEVYTNLYNKELFVPETVENALVTFAAVYQTDERGVFYINLFNATHDCRKMRKDQKVGSAELMSEQTLIPIESNESICPLRCVYIPKDPKRGALKKLSEEEIASWTEKFNVGTEDEE